LYILPCIFDNSSIIAFVFSHCKETKKSPHRYLFNLSNEGVVAISISDAEGIKFQTVVKYFRYFACDIWGTNKPMPKV